MEIKRVSSFSIKHMQKRNSFFALLSLLILLTTPLFQSCTVKAVGDPNRPITIKAHVIVDIRELKQTADSIEDYVSGNTETI